MDFDETRIYFSHQQLHRQSNQTIPDDEEEDQQHENDPDELPVDAIRRHFVQFLRNYRNPNYVYRDRLLQMHRKNFAFITVDLSHVGDYDPSLAGYLLNQPAGTLPLLELAAQEALKSFLYDTNQETALEISAIQVLLEGNLKLTPLRGIQSSHMNRLLQCPAIVTSTPSVKNRPIRLKIRCSKCSHGMELKNDDGPFAGGSLPFPVRCVQNPAECPKAPYVAIPDDSIFIDEQRLKIQEAPERVPTGEMPRTVLLYVDRNLVDVAPPGTRGLFLCIPMISNSIVYLRCVGIVRENDSHGNRVNFTCEEEDAFRALAKLPNVYDILCRSISPTIQGNYTVDIKKALACQLLGGSRKNLPDGVKLRGDINVLLLGDPSMAKSQFLKFISTVAAVGIYTSGKGSSAAGLTASVIRSANGEFHLEGGAMVLADGGIVCIDEFDKMRPQDRVAIHEAMEQQTISVAKAGITTVLNSRASVLAAANPVFGTYDENKSASDNIDLMTTILSRFDMIFLVRDVREEERDRMICQHVMGVHMNMASANAIGDGSNTRTATRPDQSESESSPEAIAANVAAVAAAGTGELSVPAMKKYIQYCKAKCSPRLSDESGEILISNYVKIRDDVRQRGEDVIPITVRQLEALVRISESLAKMRLDDEVRSEDIAESMRLFRVSTMAANQATDSPTATANNREEMERTEAFLRARLSVGSLVNRQRLMEEAAGQGHHSMVVAKALAVMAGRGELLERNQGRLIKRIK